MREFVITIAERARELAPDFLVVPQNGLELLTSDGLPDGALVDAYVEAIDGVGQEDLSYGYTADDVPTPREDHERLLAFLDVAVRNGVAAVVVDYCVTPAHVATSRSVCLAHRFAGYAAPSRNLEVIASDLLQPFGANVRSVDSLGAARNSLYLLNPERFASRRALVDALSSTFYDLLIVDAWFDSEKPLSRDDVATLKVKPIGTRRLVLAYLSIGEAEDYRADWDLAWATRPPRWLGPENPDWPGNYAVDYWDPLWQEIIFARVDALVSAGFDGVYLDRVDSYEPLEALP